MIFFDIDGTLLDHDYAVRQGVLTLYSTYQSEVILTETEFNVKWERLLDLYFNLYLAGKLSFIEQRRIRLQEMFQGMGVTLSDIEADKRFKEYLVAYEANWCCYEDVVPCLDRLSNQRLGIITNGEHSQQLKKLSKLGLTNRFSSIVSSGEAGYAKPSKEIFLEACRREHVESKDCVYVGDRLDVDAIGSTMSGMKGVWLDRFNNKDNETRVITINKLTELSDIVG